MNDWMNEWVSERVSWTRDGYVELGGPLPLDTQELWSSFSKQVFWGLPG